MFGRGRAAPAAQAPGEALRLEGVRKVYGTEGNRVVALDGVSLSLPDGSFTAVMGPSGSGKSTLLQCAAGLDRPTEGRVFVDGAELTGGGEAALTKFRRQRIGFVFQQFNLLPTLNFVVIGMVVLFTAIMLVNTLVAGTAHRSREFGQTRLAGATPRQVLGAVALESAVLTVTGVVLGTAASVCTIVPFGLARRDSPVPAGGIGTYLGVVALAAVLTGATAYGATRRTMRVPAVEAALR